MRPALIIASIVLALLAAGCTKSTSDPPAKTTGPQVYQWEGVIKKTWHSRPGETMANIESDWIGEFQVRLLQIRPPNGNKDNLLPLEMTYSITGHGVHSNRARGVETTVDGSIGGRLAGDTLMKGTTAYNGSGRAWGEVVRLDKALSNGATLAASSGVDPGDECGDHGDGPGHFRIKVDLLNAPGGGFSFDDGVPLFDSFQITSVNPRTRRELVGLVELHSADVCGKLSSADEKDVRGTRTYGNKARTGDSGGTTTWTFTRTPCNDPKGCGRPLELQGIPDAASRKPACEPPTTQRALMDPLWNQRQAKARQLEADWKQLQAADAEMRGNQEAWRAAMGICGIEDVLATITKEQLAGADEEYKGKGMGLAGAINKMLTGDLSYMAGPLAKPLDIFEMGSTLAQAATSSGDTAAMNAKLDACSALPANLQASARAFVASRARLQDLMRKVRQEVGDIRNVDQAYWDQWQKQYQACLQYAQCMHKPASDCEQPPAQPTGPIRGQQTSLQSAPR